MDLFLRLNLYRVWPAIIFIFSVSVGPRVMSSPLLYVSNSLGESISVINTETDSVIATIETLGKEPSAVAMHPYLPLAFVCNRSGAEVLIVDTITHTVIDEIPLPGNPDAGIVFHPDGRLLYVTTRRPLNALLVIDTVTRELIATIDRGPGGEVGGDPSGFAILPDASAGYVSFISTDDIWVIDTTLNEAVLYLSDPLGDGPQGVTMHPSGRFAYIPNRNSDNVTVLDTSTNTIIATIPVGEQPSIIDFDEAGTLAYVPNRKENTVSVIDTVTHQVIDTISTEKRFGMWVEYVPEERAIYISQNDGDGFVSAVDVSTRTEISRISVGRFPIGVTAIYPRPELSGCIQQQGKPVVGESVRVQQNDAVIDEASLNDNGCFQFDLVPDHNSDSRILLRATAINTP